jgi:hypothetical protein
MAPATSSRPAVTRGFFFFIIPRVSTGTTSIEVRAGNSASPRSRHSVRTFTSILLLRSFLSVHIRPSAGLSAALVVVIAVSSASLLTALLAALLSALLLAALIRILTALILAALILILVRTLVAI